MIKVVITDDHKLIRDGIKALLVDEDGIHVIEEASHGKELLQILSEQEVDVVLLDINMPGMDGFEVAQQVKKSFPKVNILALSMLDHESYIAKMIDAGANGYILKNTGKEELVFAIQSVARGQKFICAEIALGLLNKLKATPAKPLVMDKGNGEKKETGDISKRELEVLQLIADGYTNAEIADKLFTSKRTIESHRQNLLDKTGSNNTATLIKYALSRGLIETE